MGLTLLLQLLFTDVVQIMDSGLEAGHLRGDGYTWLPLVEARLETGVWSPVVVSHNAPYGLETHLTRPFAEVLVFLALPLGLFFPPEGAALLAGMLAGPLLQLATAALLAWGAGVVLGKGGVLAVVASCWVSQGWVFAAAFSIYAYDHHALHLCLSAAIIAALLRHASRECGTLALVVVAATVAGFGIWSGVEMLLPAGIGGLFLGLSWVFWGGARRAQALLLYAAVMAVAVLIGMVIERSPGDWMSVDLDRISWAHVVMGGFVAGAAGVTAWVQRWWPSLGVVGRIVSATTAGTGAVGGLWAFVPEFFGGPYANVDVKVQEYLSGISIEGGAWVTFAEMPQVFGYYLMPFVFAAACIISRLRAGQKGRCEAWLLLLVAVASGMIFALAKIRLILHYALYVAIALGAAAAGLGNRAWRAGLPAVATVSVLLLLMSPYLGFLLGDLLVKGRSKPRMLSSQEACDWKSLGNALGKLPRTRGETFVTHPRFGAQLAYLSGLGALATGCHCNGEGLADTLAILLSPPETARVVAEKRRVRFVLQCPTASGTHGHDWYIERSTPDGLYSRLARGHTPDWLIPVPASELGVDEFVVHRTTFAVSRAPGVPFD